MQCIKGIKNYISNYTSWALLRWWNSSKLFNIRNPRLLLQSHFKPTDGGSSRVITRRSRLPTRCAATSQSPIKIIQTRRPITIRYIEPCTETLFLKVTTSCVQKTNHSNTKKKFSTVRCNKETRFSLKKIVCEFSMVIQYLSLKKLLINQYNFLTI